MFCEPPLDGQGIVVQTQDGRPLRIEEEGGRGRTWLEGQVGHSTLAFGD